MTPSGPQVLDAEGLDAELKRLSDDKKYAEAAIVKDKIDIVCRVEKEAGLQFDADKQQLEVDIKRYADEKKYVEAGCLQELLTHVIASNPNTHIVPNAFKIENSRILAIG